jgi:hypothetical protein
MITVLCLNNVHVWGEMADAKGAQQGDAYSPDGPPGRVLAT